MKVSESIFSGKTAIIPMAEVHHIERDARKGFDGAVIVVLNGTTWNKEIDTYNNGVYLGQEEAEEFKRCWCRYRSELESDDIANISGDIPGFEGVSEALENLNINP